MIPLRGGVCAVEGVRAAGVAAGLKPSGLPDLALVDAGTTVPAAAVQTRNQVKAAPVQVTGRHLADGRARAILLNAGSANVCTGEDGMALAEESAAAVAAELGCAPDDVLVCSTGVIGVPIPRRPFFSGIPQVARALAADGGGHAARAIMTTDTTPKECAYRIGNGDRSCVVGGMAKGSGMIAPEMATMLCVLTTDALLPAAALPPILQRAVEATFGRISVDGCMSTNDAVIVLATGTATNPPRLDAFEEGLTRLCADLAEAIVRDGEGATKLVRVLVTGARTEQEAVAVGRAIAGSALFRTAVAGGDPNWGRVLAAMGAGSVEFDPARVSVTFGKVTVCRWGVAADFDVPEAAAALRGPDVRVTVDLGLGDAEATFLTCDLTHEYVSINAEYTT